MQESEASDERNQPPVLDAIEARILGCLIEKAATTPDVYPLTENAVVAACNQKTSREPVMHLETGAVAHALRVLEGRHMVKVARQMGAKKVYLASYSPPLMFPCLYGIDMSTKREFVARGRSSEEIAKELGADHVLYQTIEEMVDAVWTAGNSKMEFCKACFEGVYPTGDVTEQMLSDIEHDRLEASKT